MKLTISGYNYDTASILARIKEYLDGHNYDYNMFAGGGYASTKAKNIIMTDDCAGSELMPQLCNSKVSVELVEETPGAIFTYVSDYGCTSFDVHTQETEIDDAMYDFEDSEMYAARMAKMGVMC